MLLFFDFVHHYVSEKAKCQETKKNFGMVDCDQNIYKNDQPLVPKTAEYWVSNPTSTIKYTQFTHSHNSWIDGMREIKENKQCTFLLNWVGG